MFTRFSFAVVSVGLFLLNVGCSSSAQLDLSAARSLLTIATEMRRTVEEYHADLAQLDEQREAFTIQSFVASATRTLRDRGASNTSSQESVDK